MHIDQGELCSTTPGMCVCAYVRMCVCACESSLVANVLEYKLIQNPSTTPAQTPRQTWLYICGVDGVESGDEVHGGERGVHVLVVQREEQRRQDEALRAQ